MIPWLRLVVPPLFSGHLHLCRAWCPRLDLDLALEISSNPVILILFCELGINVPIIVTPGAASLSTAAIPMPEITEMGTVLRAARALGLSKYRAGHAVWTMMRTYSRTYSDCQPRCCRLCWRSRRAAAARGETEAHIRPPQGRICT